MMSNESKEEEHQRLIFSRLDPLLKMLLASVDKQLSMAQKEQDMLHHDDNHTSNSKANQEVIAVYKIQSEMLQNIQASLEHLELDSRAKGQIVATRRIIHHMQRYILLPLILILQKPLPYARDVGKQVHATDNTLIALRNAARRCHEDAAACLKKVTEILQVGNTIQDAKENKPVNTSMEVSLRIKCVVAASQSLASVIHDVALNQRFNLDKGEECIMQLLACIEALVTKGGDDGQSATAAKKEMLVSSSVEFWVEFQSSRKGQLLHSIVHCTTSILDSNGYNREDSHRGEELEQQKLDFVPTHIKGNVELKVQALSLMRSLMSLGIDAQEAITKNISDSNDMEGYENEKVATAIGSAMVSEWRFMFPGVFKALFREALLHVRITTSQSSPKIATETLKTLSMLLSRTLSIEAMHDKSPQYKDAANALLQASSNNENLQTSTQALPTELRQFCSNVHKAVPEPLILLLSLIPSHKALNVRRVGASILCKSILIDTDGSWQSGMDNDDGVGRETDGASSDMLIIAALECLITMSTDENEVLSIECKSVLYTYRQRQGDREWTYHIKEYIVPRIVALVESLPTYAKSGRESELCCTMKLISGYLMTASDENANSSQNTKRAKTSKTVLSKYLSHKLTKDPVRQCLVDMFTVDNTTKTSSKLIQYPGEISTGCYNIQYRFMRGSTVKVAYEMIHNIAIVLGYKQTVLFLDECIADLYDILSIRISHKRNLFDLEHSRFIEKHFGLVVIAKELLKSFESSHHQKKTKTLDELVSTLIPLICSDVLWQLPSKLNQIFRETGRDKSSKKEKSNMVSLQSIELASFNSKLMSPLDVSDVSLEAYNGNGAVLVCLMDLISTFAKSVGSQFDKFIPVVLYPLIQKASDMNSQSVQDGAHITLLNISHLIGHSSVQSMLFTNYGYLMETLTAELSNPYRTEVDLRSQAICFYSLHNIIEFLLKSEYSDEDKEVVETNLLLLTDMQSSMTSWFNLQFSRRTDDLLRCIMIPMGLTSVFVSCSTFLHKTLITLLPVQEGEDLKLEDMAWAALLLEFETNNEEKPENNDGDHSDPASKKTSHTIISGYVLKRLVCDLEKVLMVNSMLLALPDLKLQRKACDLFRIAFRALSSIQRHVKMGNQNDSEITSAGNPLLESVSRHWPSLQIRFKTACSLFLNIAKPDDTVTPRHHIVILLKSLLEILAELSGLCGDFIADRFINGIWPQISLLLDHFLVLHHSTGSSALYAPTSDSTLLLSILNCMNKMYSSKSCGKMLANTTSIAGTMILPFLSSDSQIGESTMNVVQSILRIDYDCLWRALTSCSGSDLAQRPLFPHPNKSHVNAQSLDPLLAKRSKDLMDFIDKLPEQSLQ